MQRLLLLLFVSAVLAAMFLPPEANARLPWDAGGQSASPTTSCIPAPTGWQFEDGLKVPILGGVDLKAKGVGLGLFKWIFFAVMALAAVLALVMLAVAGIQYITAEALGSKAAAKGRISNAILGLILAMASLLILYQINPQLTTISLRNFDIPVGSVQDPCGGQLGTGAGPSAGPGPSSPSGCQQPNEANPHYARSFNYPFPCELQNRCGVSSCTP